VEFTLLPDFTRLTEAYSFGTRAAYIRQTRKFVPSFPLRVTGVILFVLRVFFMSDPPKFNPFAERTGLNRHRPGVPETFRVRFRPDDFAKCLIIIDESGRPFSRYLSNGFSKSHFVPIVSYGLNAYCVRPRYSAAEHYKRY